MDCGGQCVMMDGITMMLRLCADSWDTVLIQVSLNVCRRYSLMVKHSCERLCITNWRCYRAEFSITISQHFWVLSP